jgi:hypothetical protein
MIQARVAIGSHDNNQTRVAGATHGTKCSQHQGLLILTALSTPSA